MNKTKRFIALLLTAVLLTLFSSCSPQAPENAELETSLNVQTGFSGERIITCTFPSNLDTSALKNIIEGRCPASLTYSADESNPLKYTFTLSFSSVSDYAAKVEELLGSPPSISFANPDSILTKGWRIEESFQSSQLLSWIQSSARISHNDSFEYSTTESTTEVTFNGETVSALPVITVNRLKGKPITKISITTVNKKPLFDRTIEFTIAQSTFDSFDGKLTDYFKTITDPSADADWLLSDTESNYLYTVKFKDITLKQLEGFTNRLLGSVYGDAEYVDKTVGSTPLASQNSYTETLDFSNYVSENNANVPVEYTYSLTDKSELGSCMIYVDSQWETATNLLPSDSTGKVSAISSTSPILTLQINDGIQYIAKSIDISMSALDGENLQKTYSFCYDLASDGYEASAYTQAYFNSLGISSEVNAKDSISVCTIKFTGTYAELNAKITELFGDINLTDYSTNVPFMTMRTTKSISDHVDVSSLLIGKNADTLVTYTVTPGENDILKSMTYRETDTNLADASNPTITENEDGSRTVSIIDGKGDISAEISVPNFSDIFTFSAISLIIILIAVAVILILRAQKRTVPAIEAGNTPLNLKQPKQNKLKKPKGK